MEKPLPNQQQEPLQLNKLNQKNGIHICHFFIYKYNLNPYNSSSNQKIFSKEY